MIGETLGNYRIVARLGAGGMGEVYRATHLLIEREVAIKVLLPELAHAEEAVERFFREARATSLIRHPGIVEVFDCAVHSDGRIYIVMELLRGESLGQLLERRGSFGADARGPCALIRQIAAALGAAHDKGIVHRDLKPDNVFLHRERVDGQSGHAPDMAGDPDAVAPRVKVLDFGIAKLMSQKFAGVHQTKSGSFFGTPLYMAPEQCRARGTVDHRADIYALGCIAYHTLCGHPPFVHEGTGDLLIAHATEQPDDIAGLVPGLPRALGELVMQMLAKPPEDRPATMAEVIRRVDAIGTAASAPRDDGRCGGPTEVAAGGTRLLTPAGVASGARPMRGRGKPRVRVALAAIAGIVVVVSVAIAGVGIVQRRRDRPPAGAPSVEDPGPEGTVEGAPQVAASVPARPTAPAPDVAPAADAVALTTVDVSTVPPGAEVWLPGEAAPRGVTPLRVSFARQGDPRPIRLQARGHLERTVIVDGNRDSVIAIELQRTRPERPPRTLSRPPATGDRAARGAPPSRHGTAARSGVDRLPEVTPAKRSDADPTSRYRRMAD